MNCRFKIVTILFTFLIFIILLFNPALGFKYKDPCIVYGYVKNQDNKLISNAAVKVVDNQTGQIKFTKSDEQGKFSVILDNYELGDQIIITASDGENTGEVTFTLNNPAANRIDVIINQPHRYPYSYQYLALAILAAIALIGLYFLLKKRR